MPGLPKDTPWQFTLRGYDPDDSDSDGSPSSSPRPPAASDSSDAQLLREIDLSARQDTAQYKPNPWSIAKINSASRPPPQAPTSQTSFHQLPSQSGAQSLNVKQKKLTGRIVDGFKKQLERPIAPPAKKALSPLKPGRPNRAATRTNLESQQSNARQSPTASTSYIGKLTLPAQKRTHTSTLKSQSYIPSSHPSVSETPPTLPITNGAKSHPHIQNSPPIIKPSRTADTPVLLSQPSLSSAAFSLVPSPDRSPLLLSPAACAHQTPSNDYYSYQRPETLVTGPGPYVSSPAVHKQVEQVLTSKFSTSSRPEPDFAMTMPSGVETNLSSSHLHVQPFSALGRNSNVQYVPTSTNIQPLIPDWLIAALPPRTQFEPGTEPSFLSEPPEPMNSSLYVPEEPTYICPSPSPPPVQSLGGSLVKQPITRFSTPPHSLSFSRRTPYHSTPKREREVPDAYSYLTGEEENSWSTLPSRKKQKPKTVNTQGAPSAVKQSGRFRLPVALNMHTPARREGNGDSATAGMSGSSKRRVVTYLPPPIEKKPTSLAGESSDGERWIIRRAPAGAAVPDGHLRGSRAESGRENEKELQQYAVGKPVDVQETNSLRPPLKSSSSSPAFSSSPILTYMPESSPPSSPSPQVHISLSDISKHYPQTRRLIAE